MNKGPREVIRYIEGWINSDDAFLPGALARVAATFQDHPEALWVHGRCELTNEQERPIRRWVANSKHRCCLRDSYAHLLADNFIHQPSVLWRRVVMEHIGPLDPRWEWAFDYDWFLRLATLGAPVYIPERYARLRWYEESKSGRHFMQRMREAWAIAKKHDPRRPWHDLLKRYSLGRIMIAYGLMHGGAMARPFTRQATKGH